MQEWDCQAGCGRLRITGMKRLLLALPAIIPVWVLAAEEWHTFTGLNGRELVGKVLRVTDNSVFIERKTDGRELMVELKQLSEKDVTFLKTGGKSAASAKPGAPADAANPPGKSASDGLYPRSKEEIRDGIRAIEKRPKPPAVSKDVHKATQLLNIYRFLCGVPSEVIADPECTKGATDAALACKQNGGLAHTLGHSTDKCNLSTIGEVITSVPQYIADSGDNNRDARGHRAWCLNPPMGKTGFGSAGASYSAMWCMDSSGKSITGTWAYPGKGLFPMEYLQGNAWSVYGTGVPGPANNIKVEVFKLQKRPEQPFAATADIPGRTVKVTHVSTGMNAINFEHEDSNKRGVYWVRVSGGSVSEGYLVDLY
jgi:hypothetical protein